MNAAASDKKPQELVFGIHPLVELLRARRRPLYMIYTTRPTPKSWEEIERLLPTQGRIIPIQYVTREVLNRLAGTTDHQGVVAWAGPFPFRKKFFDPIRSPFLVMLDSIQDTRNLGAILRSAYCTGFDGVVIAQKKSAPLRASALKASAGLAEHLEIYEAPSARAAAQELKKAGYTLYMAALGGKDATTVTYQGPLCGVIGNEAVGISPEILKMGQMVTLPQRSPDISYNASVAAGILLFLISTQNKRI